MPATDTASIIQLIQNGYRNTGSTGSLAISFVKPDPKDPNIARIQFGEGRNAVTGTISVTSGNQVTLRVQGDMDIAVPKDKVAGCLNEVGKVFGSKPVKSNDVLMVGPDGLVSTKVTAEQVKTTHLAQIDLAERASRATGGVVRAAQLEAAGARPDLVQAELQHGIRGAVNPSPNLLQAAPDPNPTMRIAAEARDEMQRLLAKRRAETPPAVSTHRPAVTSLTGSNAAEFTELIRRPMRTEGAGVQAPVTNNVHPDTVAHATHTTHAPQAQLQVARAIGSNMITKLFAAGTLAVGAGAAAAAQAPEGERTKEGLKAAGKALAEGALPGITEDDACKKRGAEWGQLGGAVGAGVLGTAGAVGGLAATPAGSAALGAGGVVAGGWLGNEIGSRLGEGVCNLVRDAMGGVTKENLAMMAPAMSKPVQGKPATPAGAQASGHGVPGRA